MPLRYFNHQIGLLLGACGAVLIALALVFVPELRSGWPLVGVFVASALACGSVVLWLRLQSAVAELVRSNAGLRSSEARYRVIFENSRDALTAVGPPDWRFVSVNKAAARLFGIEEARLLAMTPGDVSPELQPDGTPSADAARSVIQTTMRDGFADFEWTHRSADGQLIPCHVQLARFELDGQAMVQGTVRDMTEVRAAEERNRLLTEQVHEARKLEAIGRLAGGVAHDFNNMLSVIGLQADLAISVLQSGGKPREQLEQIIQVTERTARLVQQLLAFSRRQSTAPRPLNLDAAVTASLSLLRPVLGEGMRVEWKPGAGQWQVRLDPVQVDQILTNLCSNARDACKGQGRIVISTQPIRLDDAACAGISGLKPGPYLVLRVEDDGPGLSEESMAHVFEPFFTTKDVGRGTGLGLASVYGIVRQADGDARVESDATRGACFILYFPCHEGTAEALAPEVPQVVPVQPAARQARILLVEDQPELLQIFTTGLQRAGYEVRAVSNPAAALEAAAESGQRFDLLLSDVVMPGMDGLQLARELRSLHPGMSELFMSGHSLDVIEAQGFDTQGLRMLAKPFNLSQLLEAVRASLHRT